MPRPHTGLANPAKYGLTYNQVVELIESDKWKSFYDSWHASQRRKKKRNGKKRWTRNNEIYIPRAKTSPLDTFKCENCKKEHFFAENHISIKDRVYICSECEKKLSKL